MDWQLHKENSENYNMPKYSDCCCIYPYAPSKAGYIGTIEKKLYLPVSADAWQQQHHRSTRQFFPLSLSLPASLSLLVQYSSISREPGPSQKRRCTVRKHLLWNAKLANYIVQKAMNNTTKWGPVCANGRNVRGMRGSGAGARWEGCW